jgi:hypothetical protein
MKKFILPAVLFLLMTYPAFSDIHHIYPRPKPNTQGHSGHKSPADYSYLPVVIYDDEAALLSFDANADLGLIPYTVTDADDNVVLSGYIYIYMGTTPTVSVSSLLVGDYTLTIEVGGTDFIGEFTV